MIGARFGRWTIARETCPPDGYPYARYVESKCDCGTVASVNLQNLKRGLSRSCGCLKAEVTRARSATHGLSASREYRIWSLMKDRCLNPDSTSYHSYGGRGITVCQRWIDSFEDFISDVGMSPSAQHTLDRRDNSRGYSPGNVRWATRFEQANNTRDNHRITVSGTTRTLSEWARLAGIRPHALLHRLQRGWDPALAVSTGPRSNTQRRTHRTLTWNGKTLCVADWARTTGIPAGVILARLRMGWGTARTLGEPVRHR